MKKKERKSMEGKLLIAIKKTIKENHATLSDKIENAIKKYSKRIAKKATSQKKINVIKKQAIA